MSKPDGGPAFPRPSGPEPRVDQFHECFDGMTLRDYFAAAALTGRLANAALLEHMEEAGVPADQAAYKFAFWAYNLADAMLKAREQ